MGVGRDTGGWGMGGVVGRKGGRGSGCEAWVAGVWRGAGGCRRQERGVCWKGSGCGWKVEKGNGAGGVDLLNERRRDLDNGWRVVLWEGELMEEGGGVPLL